MKINYAIKNLRSLKQTPILEVRPITILLGRNSVGKSTFLRSFPLLRQSIETRSSAPVLWYGHYVDFGDFESSVHNRELDRIIEFNFQINDFKDKKTSTNIKNIFSTNIKRNLSKFSFDEVDLKFGISQNSGSTTRSYIKLEIKEPKVELNLEFQVGNNFADKILLNGEDVSVILDNYKLYISSDSVFSEISVVKGISKDGKSTAYYFDDKNQAFGGIIVKLIKNLVDSRIRNDRLYKESLRLLNFMNLSKKDLQRLSSSETRSFQRFYRKLEIGEYPNLLIKLRKICLLYHSIDAVNSINEDLSSFYSNIEYIGPARARSERYYRQQELEISEISPDGKNLPIFLASLNYSALHDFSNWVKNSFGYGIHINKSGGHISIELVYGKNSVNVVDTGYGVSQVLPVLAQIWWMQSGSKYVPAKAKGYDLGFKTLAIEQPELHLHPAHQALLADVFCEAISRQQNINEKKVNFIIETHSESLINRLGELVEEGVVSESDIQIVIFGNSDFDELSSDVTLSSFDGDGVLQNWPFGFFNYTSE